MLYRTVYGESVQKILMRFGPTEAAIVALEVLIQTAEKRVKTRGPEDLAKSTCRGLHMDKPGKGVVCAKCFDMAMRGFTDRALTGDEMAAGKVAPPAGVAVPAGGPVAAPPEAPESEEPEASSVSDAQRAEIEASVLAMLPGEKR